MITYGYENSDVSKWGSIYNGILSPFANKYKMYIKTELK
jgi:hypothetical protein